MGPRSVKVGNSDLDGPKVTFSLRQLPGLIREAASAAAIFLSCSLSLQRNVRESEIAPDSNVVNSFLVETTATLILMDPWEAHDRCIMLNATTGNYAHVYPVQHLLLNGTWEKGGLNVKITSCILGIKRRTTLK